MDLNELAKNQSSTLKKGFSTGNFVLDMLMANKKVKRGVVIAFVLIFIQISWDIYSLIKIL